MSGYGGWDLQRTSLPGSLSLRNLSCVLDIIRFLRHGTPVPGWQPPDSPLIFLSPAILLFLFFLKMLLQCMTSARYYDSLCPYSKEVTSALQSIGFLTVYDAPIEPMPIISLSLLNVLCPRSGALNDDLNGFNDLR